MNKIARVIITTECSLKCSYCCNKIKEVQESFKMTTMDEFIKKAKEYTDINITGGEPTLVSDKLCKLINELYTRTNAKLWLYTNGLTCDNENLLKAFRKLNGINVGCHDNFELLKYKLLKWKYTNKIENIRLHIQDIKCTEEIEKFCKEHDIGLKKWTLNQCNNINEDRYVI